MHDDAHVDGAPPSGGLIQLQTHAGDHGSRVAPTWAAFCGVLASNAPLWHSGNWLPVLLLILLVDAGWSNLWTALASTRWAGPADRWRTWGKNKTLPTLPYTLPGTPGDRISRWMGRAQSWWEHVFWPACGPAVRTVLVFLPLIGLLSVLLGPEVLLLSVAAVALMQIGVLWTGGRGMAPPGWDAMIAVALPWMAGHAAHAPLTLRSAGLALLIALAWGSARSATSRRARAILIVALVLTSVALVVLRRPLPAGAILLFSLPTAALLPWLHEDLPTQQFVRYTRPWLIAAMGVAALAL